MPTADSWLLEASFDRYIAGLLTFDRSTFGGTDVFSTDPGLFGGTYSDLTPDVHDDIVITRGRTDLLGQMAAGTMTLELCRPSDPTFWDPNSASSPLASLTPGFKPMRPIRLSATFASTTYYRFYGFIRTAVYDPDSQVCTIQCEDLFLWLSRVYPTIGSSSTTTGGAIGKILDAASWPDDAASWPDPAWRSLATGDAITFSADGSKNALELINDLLAAERGVFYISRAGVAVYEDRHAKDARSSSSATYTDVAVEFISGLDLDNIRNRVTVTKTGGVPQIAQDATSQHVYGIADATAVDSPYLASDSVAADLASYIAYKFKDPAPPAQATVEPGSNAQLTSQLAAELQDRITLSESMSGSSGDWHIEQVRETVGAQGWLLTSEYLLSKRTAANPLVFGTSTFGGADVFTY